MDMRESLRDFAHHGDSLVKLFASVVIAVGSAYGQPNPVDIDNVPNVVSACLASYRGRYQVIQRINPFYLRGDFDGDGRIDHAVLIAEPNSRKEGFLVCFGRPQSKPQVLGAGQTVSAEGRLKVDDFALIDVWGVATRCAGRRHDCLFVEQAEAGSGLFVWNGQRFVWVQRGI